MPLTLKPFDAAKHFTTTEAQTRLLNDALESRDPAYIAKALGTVAKARGMSSLAAETGLSRQALYASLSETGNPSLDTLMRVMGALGFDLRASERTAVQA